MIILIALGLHGTLINKLEFVEDGGTVYGPYGGPDWGGYEEFVSSHPGCKLVYLSGSSGDLLNSLTLYYECTETSTTTTTTTTTTTATTATSSIAVSI